MRTVTTSITTTAREAIDLALELARKSQTDWETSSVPPAVRAEIARTLSVADSGWRPGLDETAAVAAEFGVTRRAGGGLTGFNVHLDGLRPGRMITADVIDGDPDPGWGQPGKIDLTVAVEYRGWRRAIRRAVRRPVVETVHGLAGLHRHVR